MQVDYVTEIEIVCSKQVISHQLFKLKQVPSSDSTLAIFRSMALCSVGGMESLDQCLDTLSMRANYPYIEKDENVLAQGYKLLIIDELGYVPFSKTGEELLFEVFSQRYENGSLIVTSNLPFEEGPQVFGCSRLTGALLDRVTHHVVPC